MIITISKTITEQQEDLKDAVYKPTDVMYGNAITEAQQPYRADIQARAGVRSV